MIKDTLALMVLVPLELIFNLLERILKHKHLSYYFRNCEIELSHSFRISCKLAEGVANESAKAWDFLNGEDPPSMFRIFTLEVSRSQGCAQRGGAFVRIQVRDYPYGLGGIDIGDLLMSICEELQHLRDEIRHPRQLKYVYKPKRHPAHHEEVVKYYGRNWFELKALSMSVSYLRQRGFKPRGLALLEEATEERRRYYEATR